MKYMKTDGKAKGNIGYNVNARTNGVWLPGNYGVRPWGAQFHDAHKQYSKFVRKVLDKNSG
jgi:hypothetical protein